MDGQGPAIWFGFKKQVTDYLTAETSGFTCLPMKAGGLVLERPSKASDELYGYEPRWMRAQNSAGGGTIPLLLYFNQIGQILENLLYKVSSTAQSSYTISGSNNKIYFDRGGPFTGTIASASYTSSTLATAIAAAMNAADAAQTYAVSYSTTTKKFTITNGAAVVLTLSNSSNAVWSLIGFTGGIDTASLTSHTGASQAAEVYSHIFEPQLVGHFSNNNDYGLTVLQHMDLFTEQSVGALVTGLALAYTENDPHSPTLGLTFKGRGLERIVSVVPTFLSDPPANPSGNVSLDIAINSNTYSSHFFKMLQLQITPSTDVRYTIGDLSPVKAIRTGKIAYTAAFTWDLDDDDDLSSDHEDTWQDDDAVADISFEHVGENLRGSFDEKLTIDMNALRPSGATPQAQQGTLEQPYNYSGQYDIANGQAGLRMTLVSREYLG